MKRDPHISEFTAKKGSGYFVRVCTTKNGKKISRTGGRFYFSNYVSKTAALRAARAERDKILAEIEMAPEMAQNGLTVGDLFEQSLDVMPVAIATRENLTRLYNANVAQFASVPITALTLQQMQLALNEYAIKHAQNRVDGVAAVWRRIFQTAFFLQVPVIDYSKMLRVPKSRVPVKHQNKETDAETLRLFLDGVQQFRSQYAPISRDVALVMYYTGMRLQEALGLMVQDVDFGAAIIRVERSCGSNATDYARIVPLKTEQSRRSIPLAPQLIPVLEDRIQASDGGLLFTTEDGGPVNVRALSAFVNRASKALGIHFNLYALRHLFSADLFRGGVNPKVIQSLMGHASENMSLYYAFTNEDERTEAVVNRKA